MTGAFIKLTSDTNGELWLRADTIESLHRDDVITEIITEEKPWYVQETPTQVLAAIDHVATQMNRWGM